MVSEHHRSLAEIDGGVRSRVCKGHLLRRSKRRAESAGFCLPFYIISDAPPPPPPSSLQIPATSHLSFPVPPSSQQIPAYLVCSSPPAPAVPPLQPSPLKFPAATSLSPIPSYLLHKPLSQPNVSFSQPPPSQPSITTVKSEPPDETNPPKLFFRSEPSSSPLRSDPFSSSHHSGGHLAAGEELMKEDLVSLPPPPPPPPPDGRARPPGIGNRADVSSSSLNPVGNLAATAEILPYFDQQTEKDQERRGLTTDPFLLGKTEASMSQLLNRSRFIREGSACERVFSLCQMETMCVSRRTFDGFFVPFQGPPESVVESISRIEIIKEERKKRPSGIGQSMWMTQQGEDRDVLIRVSQPRSSESPSQHSQFLVLLQPVLPNPIQALSRLSPTFPGPDNMGQAQPASPSPACFSSSNPFSFPSLTGSNLQKRRELHVLLSDGVEAIRDEEELLDAGSVEEGEEHNSKARLIFEVH